MAKAKRKGGRPAVVPVPPAGSFLEVLYQNAAEKRYWFVRCTAPGCGNTKFVRRDNIVNGDVISCGCQRLNRDFAAMAKAKAGG